MTYANAAALQRAIYQHLSGFAALADLVGTEIYDAMPPGPVSGTYVALGPEDTIDASDMTGHGSRHDFTVSVVTDQASFAIAKEVAGVVSEALTGADLTLSRGHLVAIWFLRAQARRVQKGTLRRIDLTFRARIENEIQP